MKKIVPAPYIDQTERWVNGCESISSVMLLQAVGIDIDPDTFIARDLPHAPYWEQGGKLYGPDPWQVYPGDPEKRRALLQALPEAFPALLPTSSIAENIEINAAAANKGQALLALAAHLGLRPEQTMAFGDGLNDVTMLRDAGIGVAMGNASDELKALADCTTASCDEDGVAQTIEQFLL